MLCVLQVACASQPAVVSNSGALLSYADLATEITVGYEDLANRKRSIEADDGPVDTP